jgi:hypothetical protein
MVLGGIPEQLRVLREHRLRKPLCWPGTGRLYRRFGRRLLIEQLVKRKFQTECRYVLRMVLLVF